MTVCESNICPNDVLRLRGSFDLDIDLFPLMSDFDLIGTLGASKEVSNSRWDFSRVQFNDSRFGDTWIQSEEINRVLLRWAGIYFFFHFFRYLSNPFFLGFNIELIVFIELCHLFFGFAERMTVFSFNDPLSKLIFYFLVFLLKFLKFLILEFSLTDKEWSSFVKPFDIERFFFVRRNIGNFLNFFFVFLD